jgi:hypothetical protein
LALLQRHQDKKLRQREIAWESAAVISAAQNQEHFEQDSVQLLSEFIRPPISMHRRGWCRPQG